MLALGVKAGHYAMNHLPPEGAALPEVVRRVEAQLMQWNVRWGEPCTKPALHST
jgi:hypothetical protein